MDDKIYQVGSADNLAAIAQKYLGSVSNFRELATFNNLDIFAPLIGTTLKIPSADQIASMVSAAIAQNNASSPLSEISGDLFKDLDLSGLRVSNESFGSNPWQLISWIMQ